MVYTYGTYFFPKQEVYRGIAAKSCSHTHTHQLDKCKQPDFNWSLVKFSYYTCLQKSPWGEGFIWYPMDYLKNKTNAKHCLACALQMHITSSFHWTITHPRKLQYPCIGRGTRTLVPIHPTGTPKGEGTYPLIPL